jgi:hypothetical protein
MKKLFSIFLFILSFLLVPFKGAEEAGNEEEDNGAEDKDLQKSMDETLKNMSNLLKSSEPETNIAEMLKTAEGKKKLKAMLNEAEDEDDEEDSEKMCKKNSKMKKSLDDAIEENDQVIDGIPVIGSFAKVLGEVVNSVGMIKSSIADLSTKVEGNLEFQKSLAEVVTAQSQLIKSTDEAVSKMGRLPGSLKGQLGDSKGEEIIAKSFGEGDEDKSEDIFKSGEVPMAVQKELLLKGFQDGELNSTEVSRWESNRYNPEFLTASMKNYITKNMGGK